MTPKGESTAASILRAAVEIVSEQGYSHATTKAIAQRAGVSEGTLYRHYESKQQLFLAAALSNSEPTTKVISGLAGLAGSATVRENLQTALTALARLREEMLPMEVAILADPELRLCMLREKPAAGLPFDPAEELAQYLLAEQKLGRVRTGLDPVEAAETMLATLFGLGVLGLHSLKMPDPNCAIDMLIRGCLPSF